MINRMMRPALVVVLTVAFGFGASTVWEGEVLGKDNEAAKMEVAMEVSFSDFVQNWGKSTKTWGPSGVKHIIDNIHKAGMNRVHWRINCSGDYNYPTKVKAAGKAYCVDVDFDKCKGGIDFNEFDSLRVAVDYAHGKGMKFVAWCDQMDSHYAPGIAYCTSSKFIRDHPQFAHKLRGGKPEADPGYWTSSISYPEVVEYRLETIRELINGYGVDGVYLVFVNQVGYEEPNVAAFKACYGIDPNEVPEDDPRWIAVRAEVVERYLRKVRQVIKEAGRPVEVIVEGQGSVVGSKRAIPNEPGWSGIPGWALPNELLQDKTKTIVDAKLADAIVYWCFAEIEKADKDVRDKINLGTRYRIWQRQSAENIRARLDGAAQRGVRLFTINEATPVEMFQQWDMIRDILTQLKL